METMSQALHEPAPRQAEPFGAQLTRRAFGRAWTRDDLAQLPADGQRYELVDGILIVSPAPGARHQRVVRALLIALDTACRRGNPPRLEALPAPFDVDLSEDTVMQPDIVVAPIEAVTERGLTGPPTLAVEVLSPSTRAIDRHVKKGRLERAGAQHFWVIDPQVPSLTAWRLVDDAYAEVAHVIGGELFAVSDPVEIAVSPAALLT